MSERAPYSRVYWSIVDDEKFSSVYDNDAALACWMRLLIVADQAWPASAHLPSSAKRRAVQLLAEVELIDLQANGRYRIHGLDAERGRRKEAATRGNPTGTQLGPKRDPDGLRTTGLSQAEPSRDENEPSLAEPACDPADDYFNLGGSYPNERALKWIDDLTAEYGADAVSRHLALRHSEDSSMKTLLGRTSTSLQREARQLDRKEQAAEKARVAANRAANPQVLISRHNAGQHEMDSDPSCPACRRAAA